MASADAASAKATAKLEWRWVHALTFDVDLKESHRIVGLAVFAHYSRTQRSAWPSQSRLADMLQLDERSVRRALSELEAYGWLTKERGGGGRSAGGYGLSNRYVLGWEAMGKVERRLARQANYRSAEAQNPDTAARVNPVTTARVSGAQPGHSDPEPGHQSPDTRAAVSGNPDSGVLQTLLVNPLSKPLQLKPPQHARATSAHSHAADQATAQRLAEQRYEEQVRAAKQRWLPYVKEIYRDLISAEHVDDLVASNLEAFEGADEGQVAGAVMAMTAATCSAEGHSLFDGLIDRLHRGEFARQATAAEPKRAGRLAMVKR